MTITIDNPELEQFIEELVRSGRFPSATAVVEAALTQMMADQSPDELDAGDRAAIAESEEQIARGQAMDWKPVSAALRQKYLGK